MADPTPRSNHRTSHLQRDARTKCALCDQENELKNSHIIPECLYEMSYDHKHRFQVYSVGEGHRKPRIEQQGLREFLLCGACEQRFSLWEGYAKLVLTQQKTKWKEWRDRGTIITGLDYAKFKLFQLSVLWRSSVCSLPEFCDVNLGPHEERIRKMLLTEDPGPYDVYGCTMFTFVTDSRWIHEWILPPAQIRYHNYLAYRFIFSGLLWVYVVSKHKLPAWLRIGLPNEKGQILLPEIDLSKSSTGEKIFEFFRTLEQNGGN